MGGTTRTIGNTFLLPDPYFVINAIYYGNGAPLFQACLAKVMLKSMPLKEPWKSIAPATDAIYPAYNKNTTTISKVQLIKPILK